MVFPLIGSPRSLTSQMMPPAVFSWIDDGGSPPELPGGLGAYRYGARPSSQVRTPRRITAVEAAPKLWTLLQRLKPQMRVWVAARFYLREDATVDFSVEPKGDRLCIVPLGARGADLATGMAKCYFAQPIFGTPEFLLELNRLLGVKDVDTDRLFDGFPITVLDVDARTEVSLSGKARQETKTIILTGRWKGERLTETFSLRIPVEMAQSELQDAIGQMGRSGADADVATCFDQRTAKALPTTSNDPLTSFWMFGCRQGIVMLFASRVGQVVKTQLAPRSGQPLDPDDQPRYGGVYASYVIEISPKRLKQLLAAEGSGLSRATRTAIQQLDINQLVPHLAQMSLQLGPLPNPH